MKIPALFIATLAATAIAGCQPASGPASQTASPAPTLPVSLNAVMVGQVDHASDAIFNVGNGVVPKNDDEWREVEYHSWQMVVAGKAIQLVGTGPNDAGWVQNPTWKEFADKLSAVGVEAVRLAEAKNAAGFEAVGNKLVDTCNGCHEVFKPEIPSMGIMHKPDFPR
jgi:hypothetical protein